MDKIKIIINRELSYLHSEFKKNNNFLNYYLNSQNHGSLFSVFADSLILLSLYGYTRKDPQLNPIIRGIVDFFIREKSEDWSFNYLSNEKNLVHNLGVAFSVFCALIQYNPEMINGAVLAKLLSLLTSAEVKEGGPYYSWVDLGNTGDKNVDIGVNIFIAYFLSLENVHLPELDRLIDSAIHSHNFQSILYPSPYPLVYILSKFYKGGESKVIIDFLILKRNEEGRWSNILNTILSVISLLSFGYPLDEIKQSIRYLMEINEEELHNLYPFFNIFNPHNRQVLFVGSPVFNTALYIELMDTILDYPQKNFSSKEENEGENIYKNVIQSAEKRFSILDKNFKDCAVEVLSETLKKDKDQQVVLLSYFFREMLGEKGKAISNEIVALLGLANLYLWMAYTIYDDFLDEEGVPSLLSVANVCLREFILIFNCFLSLNSDFKSFFSRIMDKIDSANIWETLNCRLKVYNSKLEINKHFPDYQNFSKLSERSIAHSLGPTAILFLLGYDEETAEVKNLISFFSNYLIARQINDDAHDWKEDIVRGHINSVGAMVLRELNNGNAVDLKCSLPKLQKIFWFNIIEKESKIVLEHIEKARQSLRAISILEKFEVLEKFLTSSEISAQNAIRERNQAIEFLDNYKGDSR